jgi:hypothetical protein
MIKKKELIDSTFISTANSISDRSNLSGNNHHDLPRSLTSFFGRKEALHLDSPRSIPVDFHQWQKQASEATSELLDSTFIWIYQGALHLESPRSIPGKLVISIWQEAGGLDSLIIHITNCSCNPEDRAYRMDVLYSHQIISIS